VVTLAIGWAYLLVRLAPEFFLADLLSPSYPANYVSWSFPFELFFNRTAALSYSFFFARFSRTFLSLVSISFSEPRFDFISLGSVPYKRLPTINSFIGSLTLTPFPSSWSPNSAPFFLNWLLTNLTGGLLNALLIRPWASLSPRLRIILFLSPYLPWFVSLISRFQEKLNLASSSSNFLTSLFFGTPSLELGSGFFGVHRRSDPSPSLLIRGYVSWRSERNFVILLGPFLFLPCAPLYPLASPFPSGFFSRYVFPGEQPWNFPFFAMNVLLLFPFDAVSCRPHPDGRQFW